jgi:hypothetical protein
VAGDFECPPLRGGATRENARGVLNESSPPAPWQTSFDDGFCSYELGAAYCCAAPNASCLATPPIHAGPFAAACDFEPRYRGGARQARSVREVAASVEPYCSAACYMPFGATGVHDGNLFHLQGGEAGRRLLGLWAVSTEDGTGALTASVRNLTASARGARLRPRTSPQNRRFQPEFYPERAHNGTAELAIFRDGDKVLRETSAGTDDVPFVQWYVRSFAGNVSPSRSTSSLYVDDVALRFP